MNKKNSVWCAFVLLVAFVATQFLALSQYPKIGIALAETDAEEPNRCVYLTFDDGPSDKITPKILDILNEEGIKATFFIVGKQAERRKYLIKREFEEGHTVAVHSFSHIYREVYSSPEKLLKDIDLCNDLIEEVTGERSKVYRFPGGSFGLREQFLTAVTAHGMRYVDWNASMRDAEIVNATPGDLYNAAITTPANRNHIVMLAHDTTDKSATVDALKDVIKYYKENGYIFEKF